MNSIQQFIQEYKDFYNGTPWYGSNFHQITGDLTVAEALAVPGNGHSIVRILWHMIKWRQSLTERLEGNYLFRASDTDPDNWLPLSDLDETAWESGKARFHELQELIVFHLESKEAFFLDEEWLPGKTFRWLVAGVIQHDIYHLGQISLLKQLMRNAAELLKKG